jgi:hypothetical protein
MVSVVAWLGYMASKCADSEMKDPLRSVQRQRELHRLQ